MGSQVDSAEKLLVAAVRVYLPIKAGAQEVCVNTDTEGVNWQVCHLQVFR